MRILTQKIPDHSINTTALIAWSSIETIDPYFQTKDPRSFNKQTIVLPDHVINIRFGCFWFLSRRDLRPDYGKVSSDIGLLCIVFFCLNRGSIVQNRGSFVPNRGQAGDLLWCVPPNRGTAGEVLFSENNRVTSSSLPSDSILAAQIKG